VENNALLAALPTTIRGQLLDEFNKLVSEYHEARWESSEMSGGKLCEIVYTILLGHLSGSIPDKHEHGPRDLRAALNNLEQDFPTSLGRSARIQIPRVMIGVYELRNNRGVGHAGGDVKPNHMDATYVVTAAKWVMAELIRLFHDVDPRDAQDAIEFLTDRELPIIWSINGKKRVLDTGLSKLAQTLLLLHQTNKASDEDLFLWVEYSNFSMYRSKILNPGHKQRLWEYDHTTRVVTLSSLGIAEAERLLIK
jgi:hypothetical protein